MNLPKISILLTALLLMITTGCGYYNPYVANSDAEPISLHRSMWKNQTNELGLETVLYHSLSSWLRKSKLIHIKETPEEAQYKIIGKITSVYYPEISYGGNNEATELRARLSVDYSIMDQENGKIIFEKKKTYTETFYQNASPSQLQTNKKEALAEIADDISEEMYLFIINKVMRK